MDDKKILDELIRKQTEKFHIFFFSSITLNILLWTLDSLLVNNLGHALLLIIGFINILFLCLMYALIKI